jgi:ABC-2 type transport system permease protein
MNTFYWLVKREFWENRGSFLWAPVITGGILLAINLLGIITAEIIGARHNIQLGNMHINQLLQKMDADDLGRAGTVLDMTIYSTVGIVSIVMFIVVFFYCLGALYDDRRDRSILFWQSLPISDHSTVLSKLFSAVLVAPVIAIVAGVVTGVVALVMLAVTASFHGANLWQLVLHSHPLSVGATVIATIPVFAIWIAPMIGWLMLCSAWARSKPFLWAIAIPVGAGAILSWLDMIGLVDIDKGWFWRNVVGRLLLGLATQGSVFANHAALDGSRNISLDNLAWAWSTLGEPSAWIGLAAGAIMIFGAIWLRRWRTET